MSQLQIPSPSRPVSAQVVSSSSASPSQPSSNNPNNNGDGGNNNNNNSGAYTDVYAHPAAMAFAAAHPRRTIPKFGPYLLLQRSARASLAGSSSAAQGNVDAFPALLSLPGVVHHRYRALTIESQ
ncbi:hypothetical protein B0H16DRAFT_1738312 [Mycena metata]|uniref:Uncharacterized protein n=1 Tax=Mycena metata TaxID=1033252 RepID=A0AAD7HIT9_9AGAR|nr:hypothetical protein B0H16DRAFT_1738312 [Mycena metata]